MANKNRFFNQKVNKKKNISIVKIGIIAIVTIIVVIIIGFIISSLLYDEDSNEVVIELRETVAVEVNTELPDKTLFFSELENVDEDDITIYYDNVDIETVGTYDVVIIIDNEEYDTYLDVVDTISPSVTIQDVTINYGASYSAEDFITSCTDNSNEECIISFYTLSVDENGDKIDYSAYTSRGSYTIQIIASDASGNTSGPYSATLTIGSSTTTTTTSTTCTYGTNEYDTSKYTLAIDITSNGCAIDPEKYQDEDMLNGVNTILETETTKLENQFNQIKISSSIIHLDSTITPVVNTDGTGVVGYQLYIEVYTLNSSNVKSIHTAYYVKTDGTRNYVYNKYNLS